MRWNCIQVGVLEVDDLGKDFGGLPEGLGQKCASLKTTGSIRIQINAINDKPHVAVPGSVYRGLPGGTDRASLRRDLDLIRVKPLTVDEDAILELGHLVSADDDGDDPRAFPAAEGALSGSDQLAVSCVWPEVPPFVPLNDVQILNVGEGAPLAWASAGSRAP